MGDTMSSLLLGGLTSGTIELKPADVAGTTVINVPATSGTMITTADTGSVTNAMLAGSISNDKLANSTITIGGQSVALGGSLVGVGGSTGAVFSVVRYGGDRAGYGEQRVPNATVIVDSNNSFNSGSCRFTPNVAGYYYVSAKFLIGGTSGGYDQYSISIYKNGVLALGRINTQRIGNPDSVEGHVLMNGSTDYLELYIYGVRPGVGGGGLYTWPALDWHGHMVRAA
jgi:hypothetical protein